ncbi:M56 family metallopeptidase [Actinomadura harenae]|uniref:M56 family peptidase n=1 Tax=Actinomadura harenae TaxID=2483351 RepID=A0A3M2LW20_9ACTN|nr:M56 family metallopeptidase [Actinomadura harenae]RMI41714.1 M56 family peptidase [Actinomadura harenae]
MDPDVLLAPALSLVVAVAARPLSGRLAPRTAAWLLTGTAVALAVASLATLAVSALGGALRLPPIAALGHMSEAVLRRAPETDPAFGTVAAVLLTACLVSVACVTVRQGYRLATSARTARSLPGDGLLAIMDDPEAEAYALPGRPGRVVVTTGMLDVLTPAQRDALIAHERAHLAGRHHLFRALTAIAVAANPLLWPLRSAVVFATERWADERAAATIDDRAQTAQAIGRAALAHNRRPRLGHPAAALGIGIGLGVGPLGARRLGRRPGPLPRRVAALLEPPPARRPLLIAVLVGLALVSLLAAQDAASDLHALVEHAQAAAN